MELWARSNSLLENVTFLSFLFFFSTDEDEDEEELELLRSLFKLAAEGSFKYTKYIN